MTTVNVFNGPNLGRLGRRETQVYGSTTHDDLVAMIEREAADLGLKVVVRQTDSEAELLGWVHRAADDLPYGRVDVARRPIRSTARSRCCPAAMRASPSKRNDGPLTVT